MIAWVCANMMDSEVDVLVIGAGPTGLGAAKRLQQLVRLFPDTNPNMVVLGIFDSR